MIERLYVCEQFAWSPEPAKIPVGEIPVKEGKNLPNSPEEDVGNFSLAPTYSSRQLRRIKRIQMGKTKNSRKQIRYQRVEELQ